MQKAQVYELKNAKGTRLKLTNFGATLMGFWVENKDGDFVNILAGFKKPQAYLDANYRATNSCFGATVGRFAGRIANGGFRLDGKFYAHESKQEVLLHSGLEGFQHQFWEVVKVPKFKDPSITLKLISPATAAGFPGTLTVLATYRLLENNSLEIDYTATTTTTTIINLTNHSYFNLDGTGSILDHELQLPAQHYLETTADLIPTGKLLDTASSDFDYTQSKPVGSDKFNGLDTCFVLEPKQRVQLKSNRSGICMHLETNQPGLVVYTPQSFQGLSLSNSGYDQFPAICLEAQGFPNAPNIGSFPKTVLEPGETYQNKTVLALSLI